MPIRTHYDNLHISADADAETVKQAYRRLSKQYHPDLNPDPDAHRIMQLINQAYEVLSDPERRAEHDRWIAEQQARQKVAEVRITVQRQPAAAPAAASPPPQPAAAAAPTKQQKRLTAALLAVAVVMAGALLAWQLSLFWSGSNDETAQDDASAVAGSLKETAPAPQPLQGRIDQPGGDGIEMSEMQPENPPADAQPQQQPELVAFPPAGENYIRPATAPNGAPWPKTSGYIGGYPQFSKQGSYRIFVDNIRNSSDVFAELMHEGQPIRTFFIEERSQLALEKLDAGEYRIRYRQLDNGEEISSETLNVGGKNSEATVYLQRAKDRPL